MLIPIYFDIDLSSRFNRNASALLLVVNLSKSKDVFAKGIQYFGR